MLSREKSRHKYTGSKRYLIDGRKHGKFQKISAMFTYVKTDWNPVLQQEFRKEYWAHLQNYVFEERGNHHVYPPHEHVFKAFHLTPYEEVKALILGQDPYHGHGQANGLCFSVDPSMPIPPSLRNIFKELEEDLGTDIPPSGNLEPWAKRGVLLLNATLTVRANQAGSHQGKGWEIFTDEVIKAVNEKERRVVFLLWGAFARKKKDLINLKRHVVIESPHPSPLSAHRGFLGSKPFSRANKALQEVGIGPVDWSL